MKSITFTIHSSTGSSEERYSRYIMIDKPKMSISFYFNEEDLETLEIQSVSQLVHEVKTTNHCVEEMIADWGMENFTVQTTYIKRKDHLLAFEQDKTLAEVFTDFQTDHLELVHFYVAGGASFECQGYRFMVHTNEGNHQHLPHVHVIKDDENVRYSLVTLKRLDDCSRTFLRDEKKKILPALEKHLPRLQEYWTAAMGGYRPPEFDLKNKQYYPES